MALHAEEHVATPTDLRRLLASQRPDWKDLPLEPAGHGTDNVMIRLGDDLVARFPRLASGVPDLDKDAAWLPVLALHLPVDVPEVIFRGEPDDLYPLPWSVYRWIHGEEPTAATVTDWRRFGTDLGDFVAALHSVPVPASAALPRSHRGSALAAMLDEGLAAIDEIGRSPSGAGLDRAALEQVWRDLASTPQPPEPEAWLHGDLRAGNLVVRDGLLAGVIDFGTLGVGRPAAEHAPIWDYPRAARDAYRERLGLDETTWRLGRGWAILPALTGLPYYWETWPEFARLCRSRIETLLATED